MSNKTTKTPKPTHATKTAKAAVKLKDDAKSNNDKPLKGVVGAHNKVGIYDRMFGNIVFVHRM